LSTATVRVGMLSTNLHCPAVSSASGSPVSRACSPD
jgi:hypothetical protein